MKPEHQEPHLSNPPRTLYDRLEIHPDSTRLQIREAYLRLRNTYEIGNPALYSLISDDAAKEELNLIEEAFRVLSDDAHRREYDRHLKTGRNPEKAQEFPTEIIRTVRQELPVVKTQASGKERRNVHEILEELALRFEPSDGKLYKALREALGVTIEEMQDRIKVSPHYLLAIEDNRYEQLPQLVFVKGFLRSYFRYLGLAVTELENLVSAFTLSFEKNPKIQKKYS